MLRFAVACRHGKVARWQQHCVDRLFANACAAWIGVIETAGSPVGAAPLFDVAALRIGGIDTGAHRPERVGERDERSLQAMALDVVLTFDDDCARSLARCAKRGVWQLRIGASDPPCFRECDRGAAVTVIAVDETSPAGDTVRLREGAVGIVATSLRASIERTVGEAARWPALACETICDGIAIGSPLSDPPPTPSRPSAFASVALGLRLGARRLARISDILFADKWNVGIAAVRIDSFLRAGKEEWPVVDWMPEPPGLHYHADPFGASVDGRAWAFVEHFDAGVSRGRIEAFEVSPDAWRATGVDAMSSPAHMSYPFLLEHDGEWYCIPESLGQGCVSLMRAIELPSRWEKVATLIDVDAVDATLVRHDGRWWLFCTDYAEPRHHRLYAFYADDLRGPYSAHALNPVKVDPRSAGCAGTPFVVDGRLYRPAQDCSQTYGGAVVINRILDLTPNAFREETVAVIRPNARYPAGVHTLSSLGARTLVDGKRRAFTLRRLAWRLTWPIRRLRRAGS